ncbi:MAG: hypothetical protein A2168_04655 [Planctomycetes bacterium RBG_13_50_24]|nr:MAG: hypothetical protein A2168_04655 [Planctomycetes bacterium RBG_13_50_24]
MKWFRSNLVLVCGLVLLFGAANVAFGAVPANDDCSKSKAVGNVTGLAFDTTNATHDGPGLYINSPNVWYCYTATCNGCVTVSLAGSNFDTKIAAYDGCNCYPSQDDLIKTNDDFDGQQSQITFAVKAGSQYLIEVGGFSASAKGQGVINISCDNQSSQPTNDDCSKAKQVGNVTELPFDTTCATFDGPGHFFTSPNIWYRYTAGGTGDVTVSLLLSEFDTALVVYNTSDCYPKVGDIIERNDDFGGFLQSQITFHATAGNDYLFEVMGYNSDEVGEGVLTISSEGTSPPSGSSDNLAYPQPIGDVTNLPFDTTGVEQDGPHLCMYSPNLWYCYTASCTGDVTVSLAGSSFDTMLAVYSTCEPDLRYADMIECSDDTNTSQQSEIVFEAIAGTQYLIEVGGYNQITGQGLLSISCEGVTPPPSSKDDCENAKAIGNVKDMPFDTTNATFDGSGLCMTSPNIWYCYTATCTGQATVSLAGSNFDTMLAVYDGCECDPTSNDLIECNDDAGGDYQSAVTFNAIAGKQYLIEVGGYGTEKGAGLISIECKGAAIQGKTDLGDASDSTNNFGLQMSAYPSSHTGLPQSIKANFPTVYNDGSGTGPYGPVHLNDEMVAYLGKTITREIEADTGPDEDGRNNLKLDAGISANIDNGDDAIKLPLSLPNCCWTTIDYEVTVVDPNVDLWVNIWADWNRDGDWDDVVDCPEGPAPEWAVQNQFLFNLPIGLNKITSPAFLPWHPENVKNIWIRITLSEQPWKTGSNPGVLGNAGSGPQAKYLIGETEDYYDIPNTACSICKDYNGDGVIDMDDLVFFTSEWMENCP